MTDVYVGRETSRQTNDICGRNRGQRLGLHSRTGFYSARTVPVQCPYSARTQCRYEFRNLKRAQTLPGKRFIVTLINPLAFATGSCDPGSCANSHRKSVRALSTGTARALYGHCTGTANHCTTCALTSTCANSERQMQHIPT